MLPYTLLFLSACVGAAQPPSLVYQYKQPLWIENFAVRPNGFILPATANSAVLKQLDPTHQTEHLVHDFGQTSNAIMSINSIANDAFLLNTMQCDMSQLSCTKGSGITWRLEFHANGTASVTQLATGPDVSSLLNGVAMLNDKIALMVDQQLGGLWGVNVWTGSTELLFTDETMTDSTGEGGGINGIRIRDNTLYFNNPSKGSLYSMTIDRQTGMRRSDAVLIASNLSPDDFEISDSDDCIYVTDGPNNRLLKVKICDGKTEVFADGLPGPTSARWANKKQDILYISTTGGYDEWLGGNVTLGGAIYKINIRR